MVKLIFRNFYRNACSPRRVSQPGESDLLVFDINCTADGSRATLPLLFLASNGKTTVKLIQRVRQRLSEVSGVGEGLLTGEKPLLPHVASGVLGAFGATVTVENGKQSDRVLQA